MPFGYGLGAGLFARHVGFDNASDLQAWAADNPDAWGNAKGFDLFDDLYACYPDDGPPPEDGRINLDLDHWLGVAERIRHLAGDPTTP